MGDEAIKLMEQQSNTALLLALVFLIGVSIVMFKIISARLEKILDNTTVTLGEVVKVQERHSVLLELHSGKHEKTEAEIKELQKKRR